MFFTFIHLYSKIYSPATGLPGVVVLSASSQDHNDILQIPYHNHTPNNGQCCPPDTVNHTVPVLSISFEGDVPTRKVGGNLLFERLHASFLGGSGGMLPQNILKFSIWALRTIKIETMLTIFYVYYNRSFPQNLNHWLCVDAIWHMQKPGI